MDSALLRRIEQLRQLTATELQAEYRRVCGEAPRCAHRQWLYRRICWQLQAQAMGGLSGRAKQRAAALADEADLRLSGAQGFWSWTEPVQPTGAPRCPEPGVWLRRHYRGREVRVQVRAGAYKEYLGAGSALRLRSRNRGGP